MLFGAVIAALVVAAAIVRWVHCRRYFERTRLAAEAASEIAAALL